MTIDHKEMFLELVKRMTEEELVSMVRRAEANVKMQTPLSSALRAEVVKRRQQGS